MDYFFFDRKMLYFVPYLRLSGLTGPTYTTAESVFDSISSSYHSSNIPWTMRISREEFFKFFHEVHRAELIELMKKNYGEADGFFYNSLTHSLYFPHKYDVHYHSREKAKAVMSVKEISSEILHWTGPDHPYYVLEWYGDKSIKNDHKTNYLIEDFDTEAEYEKYLKENAELIKMKTDRKVKILSALGYGDIWNGNSCILYSVNGVEHHADLIELLQKLHP